MKFTKTTTFGLALSLALATAPFTSAQVPDRPEIPDLSSIIETFREAQQGLVQERRELAESLRDKTVEERRLAIEEYQAANADRIALHKALAEQIRGVVRGLRPEVDPLETDRPEVDPAERPQVAEDVRNLIGEFRTIRDAMMQERLTLLANLRDATDEDRAAALAELRAQNEEMAAQQRQRAQEIRDAVQGAREDRRND